MKTAKSLLILALLASVVFSDPLDSAKEIFEQFKNWTARNSKKYGIDETPIRYSAWKSNYDVIQQHNAKGLSWQLGLNEFADMTPEEFAALHLGFKTPSGLKSGSASAFPNFTNFPSFPNFPVFPNNSNPFPNFPDFPDFLPVFPNNTPSNNTPIPDNNNGGNSDVVDILNRVNVSKSVDWRTKNIVTHVKNQGSCGSCWTYSTNGALEGLYALNKSQLLSFSEQQLLDCATQSYGNYGCNGGFMTGTFQYTAKNGVMLEADYPYTGKQGICRHSASKAVFKNTGYLEVPKNKPDMLKRAVNLGPVAVAVEANEQAFQLYKSGIISSDCGTDLDHAVLLIGYDTSSDGTEYWIVKNSWGTSWGLNGYVHIAAGSQNSGAGVCGINSAASFPTL